MDGYEADDPEELSQMAYTWEGHWDGPSPHGTALPGYYAGLTTPAGYAGSAGPQMHASGHGSDVFADGHAAIPDFPTHHTVQPPIPAEHMGALPWDGQDSNAIYLAGFLTCCALDPRSPFRIDVNALREAMLQSVDGTSVGYAQLMGDHCDFQGINWWRLGVTRAQARSWKRGIFPTAVFAKPLEGLSKDCFFRFARMCFHAGVHSSHYQLRDNLACPTRWHTYFPTRQGVACVESQGEGSPRRTMALRHADISTLAVGYDAVMAGTSRGEYCLKGLYADSKDAQVDGSITGPSQASVNHLDMHAGRQNHQPRVTIASNDEQVRLMDVDTQKILRTWTSPWSINCTATSTDGRLRAMAGDGCDILICEAESGDITQRLSGHLQEAYACAWSDDGWTLATASQDCTVRIWDARRWGPGMSVCTLGSEMDAIHKLKFSPVGSGKPVLVAAEYMDYVNIIDAQMYTSKQTIDVFSEINGVDFADDGHDLRVLCSDPHRGGVLHLERLGLEAEPQLRKMRKATRAGREDMLWDPRTHELVGAGDDSEGEGEGGEDVMDMDDRRAAAPRAKRTGRRRFHPRSYEPPEIF